MKRQYKSSLKKPAWPKAIKAYVIGQLAVWEKTIDIWKDVVSGDFESRTQIEGLDPEVHTYATFVTRVKKIPKETIAIAHQEWKSSFDDIRWSHQKQRVEAMSLLADTLMNSITGKMNDKKTLADFLATKESIITISAELRQLTEAIRREMSSDADRAALGAGATRILIGNPLNVTVDSQSIQELLMLFRFEAGGLHNFDYSVLTSKELAQLRDRIDETIIDKHAEISEAPFEVVDDEDEDEGENNEHKSSDETV